MIIGNVNLPILRNRVENHSEIKESILKAIDDMPNSGIYENDSITKTDYQLPVTKPYWNIVESIIKKTVINDMFNQFNCPNIEISTYWFQQYLKMDTHKWHTHPQCHWTNVYYVELPNRELKTAIVDITGNNLIEFEAEEGDIISFPAMLFHSSPINMTNKRKTIISFNIDIS